MSRLIFDAMVSVPGVSGTLTGMLIPRFAVRLGCNHKCSVRVRNPDRHAYPALCGPPWLQSQLCVSENLTGTLMKRFTTYLGCSDVSETLAGMVIRHFESTHESTKDMNQRLGSKLPQPCLPEFQALLRSSFRTDEHNQQSSRRAY